MTPFTGFAMVDWSGGNDTGPRPRKDAIWVCEAGKHSSYHRNRLVVESALKDRIETALTNGERLLIGFDFPFGYPKGFARALTGQDSPLAVWNWLQDRIVDTARHNNRTEIAAGINLRFADGRGPFWGNPSQIKDVPGLPRNKKDYSNPFPDLRKCEEGNGTFTCWQLAGAGAVGSQVLMGLPVLQRLRNAFPGHVAVWPFEPLDRPIAFVEIWPGLINSAVRMATGPDDIRDAVQVHLMAKALAGLAPALLRDMLEVTAPEEGWIFGLGFEKDLIAACR